jgi:hypothetical protein
VVVLVAAAVAAAAVGFISFYKSLQNDDEHIKEEITIEVIVHKIKKDVTCILI